MFQNLPRDLSDDSFRLFFIEVFFEQIAKQ